MEPQSLQSVICFIFLYYNIYLHYNIIHQNIIYIIILFPLVSDGGEHEKPSKKDLLGRRKEKKESKKDRGYAALEGESSPEEDTDTKWVSKK